MHLQTGRKTASCVPPQGENPAKLVLNLLKHLFAATALHHAGRNLCVLNLMLHVSEGSLCGLLMQMSHKNDCPDLCQGCSWPKTVIYAIIIRNESIISPKNGLHFQVQTSHKNDCPDLCQQLVKDRTRQLQHQTLPQVMTADKPSTMCSRDTPTRRRLPKVLKPDAHFVALQATTRSAGLKSNHPQKKVTILLPTLVLNISLLIYA